MYYLSKSELNRTNNYWLNYFVWCNHNIENVFSLKLAEINIRFINILKGTFKINVKLKNLTQLKKLPFICRIILSKRSRKINAELLFL